MERKGTRQEKEGKKKEKVEREEEERRGSAVTYVLVTQNSSRPPFPCIGDY